MPGQVREAHGVLESTWNTDGAAPRRYYWLSAEGRRLLKEMTESWHCQVAVIDALLDEVPPGGGETTRSPTA